MNNEKNDKKEQAIVVLEGLHKLMTVVKKDVEKLELKKVKIQEIIAPKLAPVEKALTEKRERLKVMEAAYQTVEQPFRMAYGVEAVPVFDAPKVVPPKDKPMTEVAKEIMQKQVEEKIEVNGYKVSKALCADVADFIKDHWHTNKDIVKEFSAKYKFTEGTVHSYLTAVMGHFAKSYSNFERRKSGKTFEYRIVSESTKHERGEGIAVIGDNQPVHSSEEIARIREGETYVT